MLLCVLTSWWWQRYLKGITLLKASFLDTPSSCNGTWCVKALRLVLRCDERVLVYIPRDTLWGCGMLKCVQFHFRCCVCFSSNTHMDITRTRTCTCQRYIQTTHHTQQAQMHSHTPTHPHTYMHTHTHTHTCARARSTNPLQTCMLHAIVTRMI